MLWSLIGDVVEHDKKVKLENDLALCVEQGHIPGTRRIKGLNTQAVPDPRTFPQRNGFYVVTAVCSRCGAEFESLEKTVTVGRISYTAPGYDDHCGTWR